MANFNLATCGGNPVCAPNAGTTRINGITIGGFRPTIGGAGNTAIQGVISGTGGRTALRPAPWLSGRSQSKKAISGQ